LQISKKGLIIYSKIYLDPFWIEALSIKISWNKNQRRRDEDARCSIGFIVVGYAVVSEGD
jgi:hypothetical protein